MSVSRESDSITSRPIGANLIPFRREVQEANLIERLRQTAGPAAIEYVVRTLIEAVYAHEPLLAGNRTANIVRCMMPNTEYRHSNEHFIQSKSMSSFVGQYIDVIKHDLGKLGYTLLDGETHYAHDCRYRVVVLGASSSGSTDSILGSVIAESTCGPALRVSDHT